MDWETDRSLQLRMLATLGLIAVLPLAFMTTLSGALNRLVFPLLAEGREPAPQISVDPTVVVGLTVLGIGLAALAGDRVALSATNARTVSADERPELHGRLSRLAATAGMEPPQVAVIRSDAPNAFATGGVGTESTVAVTTGLLKELDEEQLDAVLAHELAHLRNKDATVMSIAYLLPTLTYLVSKVAFTTLRLVGHASRGRSSRRNGKAILVVLATAVVTLTVSAVFWLASNVLFRLLSQYREYAADRGAAAITGQPLALADALATIDEELRALPDRDLRELDGGVEALYISSIDVPMFTDEDSLVGSLASQELFPASHPPTADRIDRLQDLAGDIER